MGAQPQSRVWRALKTTKNQVQVFDERKENGACIGDALVETAHFEAVYWDGEALATIIDLKSFFSRLLAGSSNGRLGLTFLGASAKSPLARDHDSACGEDAEVVVDDIPIFARKLEERYVKRQEGRRRGERKRKSRRSCSRVVSVAA